MNDYQAPAITAHRSVQGQLGDYRSPKPISDAEIKHNAQITGRYEAPTIRGEHGLEGGMTAIYRSIDK